MFGLRIYIILLSTILFSSENISRHYKSGLIAYYNEQYELATQEFETIIANDWISPELYYNLGNAYYRYGQIAGSIWAYENCLRLLPTHKNAEYNLKLANLKVKDRVEIPEPPIYLKLYLAMKENFSPSSWINNTLTLFLILTIFITLNRLFKIYFTKHLIVIYNCLYSITIVFLFCSLLLTIHSISSHKSINQGIIYSPSVDVRSEPNQFSTRLFKVHEGLKVRVKQITERWLEIELLDGKIGWISENQIRLLN